MTDTMTSQNIDLSSWDILYYIYTYIYNMLRASEGLRSV
jgi:hypothetical protein